jgi:Holliday junction resolvase RusA-like endonuclease
MSNLGFMSPTAQYRVLLIGLRKRRQAKTARQLALRDLECPLNQFATGKPDVDNLLGTVMDAATAILYADDLQVVDARVVRLWADQFGATLQIDKLTT